MIRALAVLVMAAGALRAQAQPINLIPKPAPQTWTVSSLLAKPAVTFPSGSLLQLRNPGAPQWSYARVISQKIPIAAKHGNEPRARLTIYSRTSSQIQNGIGTCWWEVKDAATGARLGIYTGQTKDEVVTFSVQIPDQGHLPPIKEVIVVWHPNISPLGIWRIHEIRAWRTHGPSVKLIANANMLDPKVERSNFGGYAFGIVGSVTRLTTRVGLPGFTGTGLLVQPDLVLPLPLQPVISHDTALIGALRLIHWQAIEVSPQPALGWPVRG